MPVCCVGQAAARGVRGVDVRAELDIGAYCDSVSSQVCSIILSNMQTLLFALKTHKGWPRLL